MTYKYNHLKASSAEAARDVAPAQEYGGTEAPMKGDGGNTNDCKGTAFAEGAECS